MFIKQYCREIKLSIPSRRMSTITDYERQTTQLLALQARAPEKGENKIIKQNYKTMNVILSLPIIM